MNTKKFRGVAGKYSCQLSYKLLEPLNPLVHFNVWSLVSLLVEKNGNTVEIVYSVRIT